MVINLLKSPIPQWRGKRKSNPESVSETGSPSKVNKFFRLVGPIITSSFNEIGSLLFSNPANRMTDRQTNSTDRITSLADVIIICRDRSHSVFLGASFPRCLRSLHLWNRDEKLKFHVDDCINILWTILSYNRVFTNTVPNVWKTEAQLLPFVSLNISPSHSESLKIIGNGTIRYIVRVPVGVQ